MSKEKHFLAFGKDPHEVLRDECTRLRRLVGEREVFVFTNLLGPTVPVCHGLEACAPFFIPWTDEGGHVQYFNGRIGLYVPMIAVLALGYGPVLVEQLRKTACSRLKGARWPHCALYHIVDKNLSRAEQILSAGDKWLAHTTVEWAEAAYYWERLLNNRNMARHCLEIASGLDESPKHDFACTRFWAARAWVELLDERDRVFRWLFREMDADEPTGGMMTTRCVRLAEMWAWLGERDAAASCLRRAETVKSPQRGYIIAMLWTILLDEEGQTKRVAEKAMNAPNEDLVDAGPMFWTCLSGNKDQTRICLKHADKRDAQQGFLLGRAEAWLLHFDERQRAHRILQRAEHTKHESGLLYVHAKLVMRLLGDRSRAELGLLEAVIDADETAVFFPIAMTYLDVMRDEEACRKCLRRAEELADSTWNFIFCGMSWMELLGDRTRATECLRKAKTRARNMIEQAACPATAMRLFGDRAPKGLRSLGTARQAEGNEDGT